MTKQMEMKIEEKGYLSGAVPPMVALRLSKTIRLLYMIIIISCIIIYVAPLCLLINLFDK